MNRRTIIMQRTSSREFEPERTSEDFLTLAKKNVNAGSVQREKTGTDHYREGRR